MKRHLLLLCFAALPSFTSFAQLDRAQCIKAVVGEAAGEPYQCQIAISAVIRNRGSLKGVYGLRAKHVAREPQSVFNKVAKAWDESAKHDPTGGCKFWGGIIDDNYFIKKLGKKPVMTIGHTRFYK